MGLAGRVWRASFRFPDLLGILCDEFIEDFANNGFDISALKTFQEASRLYEDTWNAYETADCEEPV